MWEGYCSTLKSSTFLLYLYCVRVAVAVDTEQLSRAATATTRIVMPHAWKKALERE
jgi:hypothetical protein